MPTPPRFEYAIKRFPGLKRGVERTPRIGGFLLRQRPQLRGHPPRARPASFEPFQDVFEVLQLFLERRAPVAADRVDEVKRQAPRNKLIAAEFHPGYVTTEMPIDKLHCGRHM